MKHKCLVIYHSQYGASKAYAKACAQTLECQFVSLTKVKRTELDNTDYIIYFSGVYISKIRGLKKLFKTIQSYQFKRVDLCAVGLSDEHDNTLTHLHKHNAILQDITPLGFHYLPGDFDVSSMRLHHRILMRFLRFALSKNQNLSEAEAGLLKAIKEPVQGVDLKKIEPIIKPFITV